MTTPQQPYRPAPPPVDFWRSTARGIAWGAGVAIGAGIVLAIAGLCLLVLLAIVGHKSQQSCDAFVGCSSAPPPTLVGAPQNSPME
jgi:hypothetical protein